MQIIPAILTEDADRAIAHMTMIASATTWVHVDFMDGTMTEHHTCDLYDFVGETGKLALEVHLMTKDPASYFAACDAIGAKRVYIHAEHCASVYETIDMARKYSFSLGFAIAPQTDCAQIVPYLDTVDAVQVMTVEPGRQGQSMMVDLLEKVRDLRADYPELWIGVDGGVNMETVRDVAGAGASSAAVGSAIFSAKDPIAAFRALAMRWM